MAQGEKNQSNILLEYARHHGLALDHTLEDIFDIEFFVPAHGSIESALRDPDGAPAVPLCSDIEQEKFVISAEARSFLAETIRPCSIDTAVQHSDEVKAALYGDVGRGYRSSKALKLDLPLLRTDPDVDIFTCKRKQQSTSFGKVRFELMQVEDESDKGLQWPQKFLNLPKEYDQQCRTEKLSISREDVLWLRDQLAPEDASAAIEAMNDDEIKRRTVPEPLTPPLSPICYKLWPEQISSSPVADTHPLFSEHTSPNVHLQHTIDTELMNKDAPNLDLLQDNLNTDDLIALYSPVRSDQLPVSSSPARLRAERLKLEPPLTPMTATRPTKTVTFAEQSPDIVSDLLSVEDDDMLLDGFDTDVDHLFQQTFGDSAHKAVDQLENEKLIEADSTMRLPVPKLDLVMPLPPWLQEHADANGKADDADMMAVIKKMKVHKISTGFERELPWNSLPAHSMMPITEDVVDYPDLVEDFILCASVEDVVVHDKLSWKHDGLRILDEHESDDEELEPTSFAPPDHLGSLLLKRKLEIDLAGGESAAFESLPSAPKPSKTTTQRKGEKPPLSTAAAPRTRDPAKKQPIAASMQLASDLFSASDELSRFMDLQTGHIHKKKKMTCTPQGRPSTAEKPPATAYTSKSQRKDVATPIIAALSPVELELDLPIPDTAIPRPIIISSTFLTTHRTLTTHLTTLHPHLELIERDYAGLEQTKFTPLRLPISASRTVSSSTAAPDLILSPRTSIILTSLQKVKQKPLPGQSTLSPLRKRIMAVSQTCERLIVLVTSAQGQGNMSDPDERDVLALSELICWASSLQGGDGCIEVLFLPTTSDTGTERETARHILAILAIEDAEKAQGGMRYDLIPEETTWEVFLRRAGLNPFAAQIVLAGLKEPEDRMETMGKGGRGGEIYGLPAFVLMSAKEWRRRFAGVMGGARVLDRVSACLDGRWDTQM